jgi:hypothetical protein
MRLRKENRHHLCLMLALSLLVMTVASSAS